MSTVVICIFLLMILLMLFLTAPSRHRKRTAVWCGTRFAHRGLHGDGIPENSLPAFEEACRNGYGIELDVHVTADHVPVVFHDDSLQRMTGDPRNISDVEYHDLLELSIGSGCCIPTLAEVLECVDGRVPILIEFKSSGKRNQELCEIVQRQLRSYKGLFITQSFDPRILYWIRKNEPDWLRGQLVSVLSDYSDQANPLSAWLMSHLALCFLSRPDFISYNILGGHRRYLLHTNLYHTPSAVWVVRNQTDLAKKVQKNEIVIFEGFRPNR